MHARFSIAQRVDSVMAPAFVALSSFLLIETALGNDGRLYHVGS